MAYYCEQCREHWKLPPGLLESGVKTCKFCGKEKECSESPDEIIESLIKNEAPTEIFGSFMKVVEESYRAGQLSLQQYILLDSVARVTVDQIEHPVTGYDKLTSFDMNEVLDTATLREEVIKKLREKFNGEEDLEQTMTLISWADGFVVGATAERKLIEEEGL